MKHILICEDEEPIREFVKINLNRAGYEVTQAASGEEALEKFARRPDGIDIALLDVMLPGIDGFDVCKRMRRQNDSMGIIMLTARTQETDKVNGFMIGADDYITKPFGPSELTARVDALYRRVSAQRKQAPFRLLEEVESGEFALNMRTRTLKKRGKPLDLTQVEFQIMEYFFAHAGQPLSRSEILARVWGSEYVGEEKIVDVNIRRLRVKIEDDPSEPRHLITVWGKGYQWQAE